MRRLPSTADKGIARLSTRVNAQSTSAEAKPDLPLEIAHLLLIDVVGYSKLLVNEQIELLQRLNQIVRGTECFRSAEASGKLNRVPMGDGMALLFFAIWKSRCAVRLRSAKPCKIIRTFRCGWVFTAARLIGSPIKRTGMCGICKS
jgi:hypothetical protein